MKALKYLTNKRAEDYIFYKYGYLKHDVNALVKTSREFAKKYNTNAFKMFLFAIENKPINEHYLTSYGFLTREGRQLKETFINRYNELITLKNKNK